MFQFLNPAVLLGLSAAIIPLIIHLLNRRKYREIEFSSIHFLKEMVKKEMRRLRIRQILLLIVRTLIILLLVLTFSRPTVTSQAGIISGRSASEAVIIIDNSMSLNSLELTGNLLEDVRQWWFQLEIHFQTGDRISVILGTEPDHILAEREYYSSDLWQKIAKNIQPTTLRGNLILTSWKALDILEKSDLSGKEIYYISDFQKNGIDLNSFSQIGNSLSDRVKIFFLPVFHEDDKNVSIDSAKIVNKLIEKNTPLRLDAVLKNQNTETHLNSIVSLVINGERMAQNNLSIPPDETRLVSFDTQIQNSGKVSGFVECENDALLEDNRYYFNFYVPEQVNVLHFVPEPGYNSMIPTILKPALDKNIFKYEKVSLEDWTTLNFFQYQVVILEGINDFPVNLVNRLVQYHRNGYSILIIPGTNLSLSGMNRLLEELNLGMVTDRIGNPDDSEQFVSLGEVDWNHPLFEGLFRERRELNPIIFRSYYKINPSHLSQSVIRFQNGDILLLQNQKADAPVFLLASALNPEWTNILIRGFIVPLTYRILYYSVTQNLDRRIQLQVGDLYREVFRNVNPPYRFSLRKPSGQEEKIVPDFRGSDVVIQIEDNYELGNYEVLLSDKTIAYYSVNHSASESVQEYLDDGDLKKAFPVFYWVDNHENLATEIRKSRFGRELWKFFLGSAIFFVFVEMFLGYTTSRKQEEVMKQASDLAV
ncbi:MAG: BatA domain-containing protein [Calditrichaeota bacterium]|nr:BatA domain-containing protein [Calditrichota bacterium]